MVCSSARWSVVAAAMVMLAACGSGGKGGRSGPVARTDRCRSATS